MGPSSTSTSLSGRVATGQTGSLSRLPVQPPHSTCRNRSAQQAPHTGPSLTNATGPPDPDTPQQAARRAPGAGLRAGATGSPLDWAAIGSARARMAAWAVLGLLLLAPALIAGQGNSQCNPTGPRVFCGCAPAPCAALPQARGRGAAGAALRAPVVGRFGQLPAWVCLIAAHARRPAWAGPGTLAAGRSLAAGRNSGSRGAPPVSACAERAVPQLGGCTG